MTNSTEAALAVVCPTCRAPAGARCRTVKPSGVHTPRVQRGISKQRTDSWRQHERATRAQVRVRQDVAAGRIPDTGDVTKMLACTCSECSLDELVAVFAVALGLGRCELRNRA